MKTLLSICAAGLPLLAASSPDMACATEFIQNGSFEQGPGTTRYYAFYDGHAPGEVTGWVIDSHFGQAVFYYDNASATSRATGVYPLSNSFDDVANVPGNTLQPGAVQKDPDGGHFMAIDGNDLSPGDSSIYQVVRGLTPGRTYRLSFDWAGVQLADWYGSTTEQMKVWWGDTPLAGVSRSTAMVVEGTHYFSGWMNATMDFVAQGSTQVLTFQGLGMPAGSPPMLLLDGVSLTDADTSVVANVPEASTWATLLMGCGAIGAHRVRRRRAAAAVAG